MSSALSDMHRRLATFLLAFLLLAMQQEAQWHALAHVGEWVRHAHDLGLQTQAADGACAECALVAGGASAATGDATAMPAAPAGHAVPRHGVHSRTVSAPSFYLSRAPPASL